LNRLVQRKQLALTSGAPGKTRLLHFYQVERERRPPLLFVDLPGYGYAKVSRAERARWRSMIEGYLEGRAPLRGCVLLQDVRREPSEDETLLIAWLAERDVPVILAITKVDKLKRGARASHVAALRRGFAPTAESVVATSAASGDGVDELWRAIDALVARDEASR